MADSWLEYLQITQHPYLDRFSNPQTVEYAYERAVYGLPPIYFGRPEHWYGYAKNTAAALERLGEMIAARFDLTESPDWIKVLEDCEEPDSIDLIDKIFLYFRKSPHGAATRAAVGYDALPSEKQRSLLRRLGVKNFSGTRTEASAEIDRLKTW